MLHKSKHSVFMYIFHASPASHTFPTLVIIITAGLDIDTVVLFTTPSIIL
jgi:hypothetical protein